MVTAAAPQSKKIVDKAFAHRLEQACETNPHSPSGHGRQVWVIREFKSKLGETITAEAVRKWFAGEARPRPSTMAKLAQILEVDEAWLSLGITPAKTPLEKKRHNAMASGAINVAAGLFQLSGGNIAFPEGADKGYDFMTIVNGKSYLVQVKYAPKAEKTKVAVEGLPGDDTLVLLLTGEGLKLGSYEIYRLNNEVFNKHGKRKGGFTELDLDRDGSLHAGEDYLPIIKDFSNLAGEIPRKRA